MVFQNRIGLGTWCYQTHHQQIIESAIDIGYRMFDTAESYSDGQSEIALGQALKTSTIPRNQFEIVSKFLPHTATNPETLKKHCYSSLKRLNVDYLDVYLLHFLDTVSINQTIESLIPLIDSNLVKHIGVCNLSISNLNLWIQIENELDLPAHRKISVVQHRYNLIERHADLELNQRTKDLNLTAMFHTPFNRGRNSILTKQDTPGVDGDFWASDQTKKLTTIAESIGATLPQFILAYLHRWPNSVAIPKTFKINKLKENFESLKFIPLITENIIESVEQLFPIKA
jgi:diketogulonate reductase-like aldo/keto reductase